MSRDVVMREVTQLKEVKVELQLQQSEVNSPHGPSTLAAAAEKIAELANKIAELDKMLKNARKGRYNLGMFENGIMVSWVRTQNFCSCPGMLSDLSGLNSAERRFNSRCSNAA